MSKIGKKPIDIPEGVEIKIEKDKVQIKGPNATLEVPTLIGIEIKEEDNQIIFTPRNSTKQTVSNWGTLRALVQNAVDGSKQDFSKKLLIEGVGYRATMEGKNLLLNLGFSHPIKFESPENVKVEVDGNAITISGPEKALVGEVAANIRKFRKPEPYKGKGIRYEGEIVRRKAGKKAVGSGS
ncbi:MAG: 50S ribosomal protein L6 [Candidatus Colwellbacteria bacterium CG10_big_fil_rev_8_21_14_0_10_41_28]|uniref:Large ribosomal subunit protein uL6 n=1 Tax=Candidatus Colwellbacteria bacterium CG10_big_fil_rev_8_21_14_0_10_41_28 TaxID=1974539 RepID=A0A2H0VJC6_9BACT|nr:MAG: 50S ribosomal protein L6 [Candidatus Colwellbacteria bacterium CG10_big_fil_rev_8_21_14_0_10_41_28]